MQKFKKKFVKLGSISIHTANSDTTVSKLPKEKPQKKIVQQKSNSNASQLPNQIPEEAFITYKPDIAGGKLANQIPEEKFVMYKPAITAGKLVNGDTFITYKPAIAGGKLANQIQDGTFVTQKLAIATSVAPLWKKYTERPLPSIPNKYADTNKIPFIDEEIDTSDLSTSVYDEIAPINNENHSTKSSIGDSGIDDISIPDSVILSVDKQNETKSGLSFGINTAVGIKSENEFAAHMFPPLFEASRNTGDPFHLSIKPVKKEYNIQTSETSKQKHTSGRPQNDQENLTLPGGKSSVENEAIIKRPALPKIFDTLYNLGRNKDGKTVYPTDVNSISGREQSKDFAEREIAKLQNQNSFPSADTQKEAHTQKSNTFSTNVNKEQVENTPSGIKGFTSTSNDKHEDIESEPIYCEPWDLKPIPGLDEYQHTDSIDSLHKKAANQSTLSTHQEEVIYESLDDIIKAYLASDSLRWFSGEFAKEGSLELHPYKEESDDKSKIYAQVKRSDNVRSGAFNLEDGAITPDRPSITTPSASLKEHTVNVSFGETQHKTITATLPNTRKTVPQEEETHKTVPNKSWFRRILDRITKVFSQGYAILRSIFTRSTKNKEIHFDQSFSLHNENGKLSKIKEALSQNHPLITAKAGELNEIKEALSQKRPITPGKTGELSTIREALSQKRPITPGKTGELSTIKEALSQKRPITPGKTGELSTIREALSQKRPITLGKTGELSTIREALSQKRPITPGKTGELSTIKEALSQKRPITPGKTGELSTIKEALSQKRPITPGKTGELSTIREALSQKRPITPGKTGELSTIKEALSQKRPITPGKTGELSTIREALSEKHLLLQDNIVKLGNAKEALPEKGFSRHLANDEQNKGQDNLYKDRYAFSTCTDHNKIKSILTRENGITDKLRESGMKEEKNKTCVPSLGCNSHLRNQASRVL
ncbi:hypothetical protein [Neorickettsia findlayensis]|uniref:Uncharacterized protein n=1 Tax=Neorickettsia findlayensis TaxID=2686014 RepID=A0A6P1G975_9RICK|nr:hypothetical protein [Neorickettsia findlayensis]QHD64905.1 hypothetical protein GP480_00205 [Neorickettsia findlayensis]